MALIPQNGELEEMMTASTKPSKTNRIRAKQKIVERKFPGRKFIEFPGVKGRTVEKIEMFTAAEHHSITVAFQDKTVLVLALEPGFTLQVRLESLKSGNAKVIRRWRRIRSAGEGE